MKDTVKDDEMLDVSQVDLTELTSIVTSKFSDLTRLENNVKKAVDRADRAKSMASSAQVSAGLGKKKAAIELLQEATMGLADAQISAAEAQKLLFEYQTKLTNITKGLFALGVSSIAANRTVVREVELKLKGASKEKISELAQQELKNVILQLNQQMDMMEQQKRLTEKVKAQAGQIRGQAQQLEQQEQLNTQYEEQLSDIQNQSRAFGKQITVDLEVQKSKDIEHDQKFAEKDITDKQQDQQIQSNSARIGGLKEDLESQKSKDIEHDRKLAEKDITDKKQYDLIQSNSENIDELKESLNEQSQLQSTQYAQISDKIHQLDESLHTQLMKLDKMFEERLQTQTVKNTQLDEAITGLSNRLTELKNQVEEQNNHILEEVKSLLDRIENLENLSRKKIWKITVSILAASSVLMNILQICGII